MYPQQPRVIKIIQGQFEGEETVPLPQPQEKQVVYYQLPMPQRYQTETPTDPLPIIATVGIFLGFFGFLALLAYLKK